MITTSANKDSTHHHRGRGTTCEFTIVGRVMAVIGREFACTAYDASLRATEICRGERFALPSTILDITVSGADVALDPAAIPFVGVEVRVDARYSTVVRPLENAVAVQSAKPFTADTFDERLRP